MEPDAPNLDHRDLTPRTPDPRTAVRVAAILGGACVVACVVLVVGFWLALDHAAGRLERSVGDHSAAVRAAGASVGTSVEAASVAIDRHAQALSSAGAAIARPEIKVVEPVPIKQPVEVRGPASDGALPVDARLAK